MSKYLLFEAYLTVRNFWKRNKILILLLFVSFLLRLILVERGGQFFWPDELRFYKSHTFLFFLKNGDVKEAIVFISHKHVHTGFIVVAAILEIIRYLFLSLCMPNMALKPELLLSTENALWVPSLFLSTASVVSIALVYAIARKSGAEKREGIIAAFMMTCSTTMFYYSRHFLPYDVSMATALFAIWLGLNIKASVWKSLVCGAMAGVSFMLYNGYWILALIAIFIHISWGEKSTRKMIRRGIITGAGFAIAPIILTIISVVFGYEPFLLGLIGFSRTIKHGSFDEGWLLVWEYLWHAEHMLLLVWIVSTGAVIWLFLKRRQFICTRGVTWLIIVGSIYSLLFLHSTILKRMTVYGRTVRQMVPFFCLITAYAFEVFINRYKSTKKLQLLSVLAVVLILIQVVVNFKKPLMQQFPFNVKQSIMVKYGVVSQDITVKGPGGQEKCSSEYVLLNARHLYPVTGAKHSPAGKILFQAAHPLQYIPYQYEGHSPNERFLLRTLDISMRLIHIEMSQLDSINNKAAKP